MLLLIVLDDLVPTLVECKGIMEWEILGCMLGVSEADLTRIQRDKPTELLRLKAVLSQWISSGNATWKSLASALLSPLLNAKAVAQSIANKHPIWSVDISIITVAIAFDLMIIFLDLHADLAVELKFHFLIITISCD